MTNEESSNSPQANSSKNEEDAFVEYIIANKHFKISNLQEKIIKISELLITKHYTLNLQDLLNSCISMLEIKDENRIFLAIHDLIEQRILVQGKALALDKILENDNRKSIFELIQAIPGLNKLKISEFLGLNYATTTWHLDVLERFKIIRPKHVENQNVYFESSLEECFEMFYYFLQKRDVNQLLSKILENPGISPKELLDLINISKSTFYRKIQELHTHDIIGIEIAPNESKNLFINKKFTSILKELNSSN